MGNEEDKITMAEKAGKNASDSNRTLAAADVWRTKAAKDNMSIMRHSVEATSPEAYSIFKRKIYRKNYWERPYGAETAARTSSRNAAEKQATTKINARTIAAAIYTSFRTIYPEKIALVIKTTDGSETSRKPTANTISAGNTTTTARPVTNKAIKARNRR